MILMCIIYFFKFYSGSGSGCVIGTNSSEYYANGGLGLKISAAIDGSDGFSVFL